MKISAKNKAHEWVIICSIFVIAILVVCDFGLGEIESTLKSKHPMVYFGTCAGLLSLLMWFAAKTKQWGWFFAASLNILVLTVAILGSTGLL